jgi:hypothetical protein
MWPEGLCNFVLIANDLKNAAHGSYCGDWSYNDGNDNFRERLKLGIITKKCVFLVNS